MGQEQTKPDETERIVSRAEMDALWRKYSTFNIDSKFLGMSVPVTIRDKESINKALKQIRLHLKANPQSEHKAQLEQIQTILTFFLGLLRAQLPTARNIAPDHVKQFGFLV